jgi:hypothetical protein
MDLEPCYSQPTLTSGTTVENLYELKYINIYLHMQIFLEILPLSRYCASYSLLAPDASIYACSFDPGDRINKFLHEVGTAQPNRFCSASGMYFIEISLRLHTESIN